MTCPGIQEAVAQQTLKTDTAALAVAHRAPEGAEHARRDRQGARRVVRRDHRAGQRRTPTKVDRKQATACGAFLKAQTRCKTDTAALAWTEEWSRRRANVSDGQLLFEANCARCHTAGWSTFNSAVPPDQPGGLAGVGLPGGGGGNGGGIGFNLRNRDTIRRFGDDAVGRLRGASHVRGRGLGPEQGLRRHRDRLGPHARLHQHDDAGADRRGRELRALLPRHVYVPRRATDVQDGERAAHATHHDHDLKAAG